MKMEMTTKKQTKLTPHKIMEKFIERAEDLYNRGWPKVANHYLKSAYQVAHHYNIPLLKRGEDLIVRLWVLNNIQ